MLKNSAALYLASTATTTGRIEEIQRGSSYKLYILKLLQSLTSFCGKGELGRYLESSSSSTSSSSSNGGVSINHSSLLWQTFLSITISILFESFVRNLSSDSPNLHSFNLLSFSFLLHVQSHTTTTKDSLLGEDEKQLYVYLLLTLLELSSLQLSYLSPYFTPRRRRNRRQQRRRPSDEEEEDEEEEEEEVAQVITTKKFRFLITLTFSMISQFLALKSYYSFYTDITTTTENTVINNNNNNEGGGALIWFNKLPEICFELIVITSLGLKLSATLLRGEELSKENLLGAPIHWEYEEDFAIVLIKYTTALLKATRLSSLSYELSPLNVLPSTIATSLESIGFDLSSSTRETYLEGGGGEEDESSEQGDGGGLRVRLERNGDVLLIEELIQSQEEEENTNDNNDNDGGLLRRRIGSRKSEALTYGFSTEIKSVQVEPLSLGGGAGVENSSSRGGREWNDDWGNGFNDNSSDTAEYFETDYDSIGRLVQGGQRRNHLLKFFSVLSRISFYLVYLFIVYSYRIITSGLRFVGLRSFESKLKDTWRTRNQEERKQQQPQSRRGEGNEDDQDDDQDWKPSSDDDSSSDEEEEEGEEEEEENALALISDLSRPIDSSNDDDEHLTPTKLAPYLLAHHLSPSSSTTLTRRRYQSLLKSSSQRPSSTEDSSLSQLDQAISSTLLSNTRLTRLSRQERESKRQEWRESRSNFCVVCTVEPRTVILWPCRKFKRQTHPFFAVEILS
jgi:hypothetical protein